MERIGEKIKALRESEFPALSQEDLAKRSGVSQTTIADLERGRNETSKRLMNIAKALHVSTEELNVLPVSKLLSIAEGRRKGDAEPEFLSRKSATPKHNPGATRALIDLARELERGDLPPDVQTMLQSEIEAKAKIVRAMLSRYVKSDKK